MAGETPVTAGVRPERVTLRPPSRATPAPVAPLEPSGLGTLANLDV
eukprot:gene44521-56351_t